MTTKGEIELELPLLYKLEKNKDFTKDISYTIEAKDKTFTTITAFFLISFYT